MNILFIAPVNSIHSKRWIEYFSLKENLNVHVLTFNEVTVPINGVEIHVVDFGVQSRLPLFRGLKRWLAIRRVMRNILNDFSPDIIHIHDINKYAYVAARLVKIPLVATTWGSDILVFAKRDPFQRLAVKRIIQEAEILTCDATHMKEEMVSMGANPEKIEIIYFGTNVEDYTPKNRDAEFASKMGWNLSSKTVISTRALSKIYDIGTFIRSMPIILESIPTARFVIVGDGEEREKLELLSEELGVADKVRFTGRLSDEDLKRFTASADIYVSTSLSDGGIAASTAEAMSSGIPVVVTDFGDNAEWLDNEQAGKLFPLRDYKALAEKNINILNTENLSKAMGARGREIILEKNNYHREMGRMLLLYRNLLKR